MATPGNISGLSSAFSRLDLNHPKVKRQLERDFEHKMDNADYDSPMIREFMRQKTYPSALDPFAQNDDFLSAYKMYTEKTRKEQRGLMDGARPSQAGGVSVEELTGLRRYDIYGSNMDTAANAQASTVVNAGVGITHDDMKRATNQMMGDSYARRGLSQVEFVEMLSEKISESNPRLLGWALAHADEQGVTLWQIIAACAIDQMLNGSVKDLESDSITDINKELKKLEEVKYGKPVAESGSEQDQRIPF